MTDRVKITTPAELRALLLETAVGVLDQRVNVSQANAVIGCSVEVHKSIRQEFEMRCFAAENLEIKGGEVIRPLLEHNNVSE